MTDVAREAKVSLATVSAYLNGTVPVSPERSRRIADAIEAIGYRRNGLARSLRTGMTSTIGLIVTDITNPFFTDVVAAIQDRLDAEGYAVMLCSNNENQTVQSRQVDLLTHRAIDGLIMAPVGDDSVIRDMLAPVGIPIVLIDRQCQMLKADTVTVDNLAAVERAVSYLIDLGHRRIGFIAGTEDTSTGRERLAGYRAALERAGLPFDPGLVALGRFRESDSQRATISLLSAARRPTALFAANNLMLIGVMKALKMLGLACPGDVSVAGFDDFPWAGVFEPQLTTIRQPTREIGEQAAELMLSRLRGGADRAPEQLILRAELLIRGSCRQPDLKVSGAGSPAAGQRGKR